MQEKQAIPVGVFTRKNDSLNISLLNFNLDNKVVIVYSDGYREELNVADFNHSLIDNSMTGQKELVIKLSLKGED